MDLNLDSLRLRLEQIREEHPRTSSSATVYFVRCNECIKIGTTRGPIGRFSTMQTNNPSEVICVYSFNCIDAYGCEGKIQDLFQQHRQEWFYISNDQLDVIRSVFNANIDADPAAIAEDDKAFKIHQYGRAFSHFVNTFPYASQESLAAFLIKEAEEKLEEQARGAEVELVASINTSKKRKRPQKRVKVMSDQKSATQLRASLLSLTPEELTRLDFQSLRFVFKHKRPAIAESVTNAISAVKSLLATLKIPFEAFLSPDGTTEITRAQLAAAASQIQDCWTTMDLILKRPASEENSVPTKLSGLLRRIFRYFGRQLKANDEHCKVDKWLIHMDPKLE